MPATTVCRGGDPGSQARELGLQHLEVGVSEVVADLAQVQVAALRPVIGPFDPRRDDARGTGTDDIRACSRPRQVLTVRSARPV